MTLVGSKKSRNDTVISRGKQPKEPTSLLARQGREFDPKRAFLEIGNCAETNPLIQLAFWRQDLPIRLHSVYMKTQIVITPCESCLMMLRHNTSKIFPRFLIC